MEKRYDEQFKIVFDAIRSLLNEKAVEPPAIGFRPKNKSARHLG